MTRQDSNLLQYMCTCQTKHSIDLHKYLARTEMQSQTTVLAKNYNATVYSCVTTTGDKPIICWLGSHDRVEQQSSKESGHASCRLHYI
jgi:hypothetical protein